MQLINEDSAIVEQTKGLCQAIIDAPGFKTIQQRIVAFMSHDLSQTQYRSLSEKRDSLQQKQDQGQQLTDEEIAAFEQNRQDFINNPIAKSFLDAQEELHGVKKMVTQYVSKTLELGRVPTEDEVQPGECGSGCNCH